MAFSLAAQVALGQVVNSSTMTGKFLMGYQGWRACIGDGSPMNSYVHWSFNGQMPSPDNVIPDIWPDTSELTTAEKFSTAFTMGNGQPAKAYSSYPAQTVARHFQWMQANDLDGVMLQRFIWDVKGSGNPNLTALRNQVALNVKAGAETYGRVFALMYDLSGEPSAQMIADLQSDWASMTGTLQLTNSSRYLKHNGKPVVCLWGIGFTGVQITSSQATTIINWFKSNNCTVMGGVPYFWRTLDGDSNTNAAWLTVYHSLDVLSPWSVGRYNNESQADSYLGRLQADLADCQNFGVDYMPVAFPGYSSHNLNGGTLNGAPRMGGRFYWRQIYNAVHSGCDMLYGAMFDEIDEGTALYKLAPTMQQTPSINPATTSSRFFALDVDGESLPSDWYLRATDAGTKAVSGETPLSLQFPITPTNGITVTYPNGGQVLTAGDPLTVTWNSSGTIGNVNIDIASDGKSFRALVYNTPNTGSKAITVPYYGNTVCRIRVQRTNGVPVDWSDTAFSIQTPVPNPNTHLTKIWSVAPDDRPYLGSSGSIERGIAYDSLSDKVFIVHREGSVPNVYVLNGATGADLNTLNTTGISGGGFVLDRIGVADDGAIYAGNVAVPGTNSLPVFKLYRWANANSATVPTLAYSGAAGFGVGIRVGDTLTVRGAGTGTQILVGGRGTNAVSILTTANGTTFTPQILTTTLNKTQLGSALAFGLSNTYWVKTNKQSLFRLSYNLAAGTSTTLNTYANLPPGFSPFAVDPTNSLLADIDIVDGYDQLNLYDISNLAATPVLLHSFTFPADNENPFGVGSVVFGRNDRCYALNANNGVLAFNVLRKAEITTQPQSQTVNAGSTVNFSVAATGSSLSYQWKKNGANITGATTDTLTLANVQAADAADYTVVVSNNFSSDTSATATLTVIVPPSITTQPQSQTKNYGATATFTVVASGTSPTYQWQKNGVNLSNGGNVSGARTATLTLTSVTQNDAANYRVIVSNAAGSATSSAATLTVVDPIITSQPQSQSIAVGNPVTFSVTAIGTAPLSYQWRKNGANISGATSASYTISSVQSSDAGNYTVVVSNSNGSVTSSTATLTVNVFPPSITTQPASQSVSPGANVTFNVTASGTPPLSYQWKFNGANISGATGNSYTKNNVQSTDQGNYAVVVSNPYGSATSANAVLTVKVTIILDNTNAAFVASANWSTGTSSTDKYSVDYRFRGTAAVSDPATWTANLGNSGTYNVYAWWPQGANRSTTAPYIIYHGAGSTTVNVNQQTNGGQWNLLGNWTDFVAGNNDVKLSCWTTTGFVVMADAVEWVQQ